MGVLYGSLEGYHLRRRYGPASEYMRRERHYRMEEAKMGVFANELRQMAESYGQAKANPSGAVPDSNYNMQLQLAELRKTQSGNLRIYREHLILDGEFAGEVVRDGLNLNNDVGMRIAIQWIERLGFPAPEDVAGIEDVVAEIMASAPSVVAKVKTKDDFTNVSVLRLLDGSEAAPPPAPAPAPVSKGRDSNKTPNMQNVARGKPAAKKAAPAPAEEEPAEESMVGKRVTFTDPDGNAVEGNVAEQDGDLLKVIEDSGQEWEEVNVSEVALVDAEGAAEEAAEEAPAEEDPRKAELLAFAQAYDLPATEESTVEEMVELCKGYDWDEAQMTADEAKLMRSVGVAVKAKAKAPAKPAPKAAPAKPAAKPAAKAPAKPAPAAKKPAAKAPAKPVTRKK